MKAHLQKTLFVVLPLTGLLVTTLSACDPYHRHSYHSGASYGGYYGQAHPSSDPYDAHHDEHDHDHHDDHDHDHGY